MINNIKMDYYANHNNYVILFVLLIYRMGNFIHYCKLNNFIKIVIKIPLKIIYKIIQIIFQFELPFSTEVGGGLRLRHLNGIIINANTKIGTNCTIFQQVTIGSNEQKGENGGAILGNNVYIGAGAKIIGKINICNDVNIGANAVVSKNVNRSCTVVEFNKQIKIK